MKIEEKAVELLKSCYVCDSCLGRNFGQLLSGLTNKQRGNIIRHYLAFLIDSGETLDINLSNFYGMKFRNVKFKPEKPENCKVCQNFFLKIDKIAERIVKTLKKVEFSTFLVGSVLPDVLMKTEEELWSEIGVEFTESIKSEINREIGKAIEKQTKKRFEQRNPDITIVMDFKTNKIRIERRSLYIFGSYQKLARGIPQTKWLCRMCEGRGCKNCKGKGKMYPISVQEIIEKPFLEETGSEKSSFHGSGREDIDARCLGWRPFVIEIENPVKRSVDLRKIKKEINKSKKVKVRKLRLTTKDTIKQLKFSRSEKTYMLVVEFDKAIDRKKLKELKTIVETPIIQKTPLRVVHRRADKFRKRLVKKLSYKILGKKKLQLTIRAEAGLYIKELITSDEGRTKPSIANILDNKVKRINLDIIKIHK